MVLERLLGSLPRSTFLDEYYLKLPFSLAATAAPWTNQVDWDLVERLLAAPGADVVVARSGQLGDSPSAADAAQARALFAEGYTLLVRHAERHDGGLAKLAGEFARELAGPVDVHVYATPAGQFGFGWHYDAEDVFILQATGSKEFSLRKNTVNPWPLVETLPADMRYEREIMPIFRCTLSAGDWLYIPHGYWHQATARSDSVSLAVGVLAPSGIDALDVARRRLLDSLPWRGRLPVRGAAGDQAALEQRDALRETLARLGDDLARLFRDEAFAAEVIEAISARAAGSPSPGRPAGESPPPQRPM